MRNQKTSNAQRRTSNAQLICQGGESNSRPRAYESPALPLSYPGQIGGDKGQSRDLQCQCDKHHDESSSSSASLSLRCEIGGSKKKIQRKKIFLLFWLPDVRLQVLVIAPDRGHEAYITLFLYCADPAFLMNVAPSGELQHRARFRVAFSGKKK